MKFNKRRAGVLVGGVGVVAALAALTIGGTSALFSSGATGQNNNIAAGKNVLTENSPVSSVLNVSGFMPGDTQTSKYALKYAGQDAFVGLDLKITSVAQAACGLPAGPVTQVALATCTDPGEQPMYNGAPGSGSLDLSVAPQNDNTYNPLILDSTLQAATTCSADAAGLVTCVTEKKNIPIPPGYISSPIENDLIWTDGKTDSISVTSKLPLAAPNAFQGSTVKIDMVAHAVQSKNNSTTVGSGLVDPATTFGYGAYGTGGQASLLFPKSWS